MPTVSANALKKRIVERQELAILDVREQGIYFDNHLLWATNLPLSRLELEVNALVPRRTAPMVVYDSGPENKERAAIKAQERLSELGYTDVSVLTGGTVAWQEAGFELFSGLNVPSKTFGEYLLQQRKPSEILPQQLNARLQSNENLVVLDSRPFDEYVAMSIPTAIDVPGAELVYRVFQIAPDPETDVVVNCAGRTRSIVGAMSLVNAGIPNRVMLLKDGTMGWQLAGLDLESGKSRVGEAPECDAYRKACEASERVSQQFGVRFVDCDTLQAWREDTERTLYLFDVRTESEYLDGHLRGARHAPGGQLVQTTDEFIAVRNARIVVIDDRKVRATMTASWLMQMGHKDVFVLNNPFENTDLEIGPEKRTVLGLQEQETVEPGELKAALESGEPVTLVDVSSSSMFRTQHIEQALWCIRQRLEFALALRQPVGLLVLTCEDGVVAQLAATDIKVADPRQLVRVLNGGNLAWQQNGFPMTSGMSSTLTEVDDIWLRPYHHQVGQEQRMKNYLEWEVQLMDQAKRDGTVDFHCS